MIYLIAYCSQNIKITTISGVQKIFEWGAYDLNLTLPTTIKYSEIFFQVIAKEEKKIFTLNLSWFCQFCVLKTQ